MMIFFFVRQDRQQALRTKVLRCKEGEYQYLTYGLGVLLLLVAFLMQRGRGEVIPQMA